jgi:CDK inhibitor PHO81
MFRPCASHQKLRLTSSHWQYIAKMADIVAANLLDLARGSAHLNTSFLNDLPEALGADGLSFDREVYHDLPESTQTISMDAVSDLEFDLERVLSDQSPGAVREWLRMVRERQQQRQNGDARVMRLIWRAIEALPREYLDTILTSVDVNFNFIDNINGRNPLHESCIAGRLELVEVCLDRSVPVASTDAYGRTPLHYAAMYGHTGIAGRLLQQGADATTVDMDGHTPVIQAIISGNEFCVKILVEKAGTNILEPTAISNDLIPLSLACQHGRYAVAKLLLENGAKILPNSEGLYPQHLAARAGHAEICQLLVDMCGPDGGGKDRHDKYNMWTPLHHACIGGSRRHLACMRVLVQAGCDVNAEDEYGKTPGFYAAWYGQIACLAYLKESGAKLETAKSPKASTILANLDLGRGTSNTSPITRSPNSDGEDEMALDGEVDMIPSLSLPPPIIP